MVCLDFFLFSRLAGFGFGLEFDFWLGFASVSKSLSLFTIFLLVLACFTLLAGLSSPSSCLALDLRFLVDSGLSFSGSLDIICETELERRC